MNGPTTAGSLAAQIQFPRNRIEPRICRPHHTLGSYLMRLMPVTLIDTLEHGLRFHPETAVINAVRSDFSTDVGEPYSQSLSFFADSMLNTEDEICMNDAICSSDSMSSRKRVTSFQDEDYAENIKQFQLQVDKVKKVARPGCSPEILNAALGSMSSLFDTLSLITSKRYIRASL